MPSGIGLKTPAHPIFNLYTLQEISERTGYSHSYLVNIMRGNTPANRRVRANCVLAFHRLETELFAPKEPRNAA